MKIPVLGSRSGLGQKIITAAPVPVSALIERTELRAYKFLLNVIWSKLLCMVVYKILKTAKLPEQ
jgi:hypothetical protein